MTSLPSIDEISIREEKKKRGKATGLQIYNLLSGGEVLRLSFPTLLEANRFRGHIATIKSRQDNIAIAVGLFTEEEKQVFTTTFESKEEPQVIVVFEFVGDKKKKTFSFEIVDRSPSSSSDAN